MFEKRADGTYDIVNPQPRLYLSYGGDKIITSEERPTAGWMLVKADEAGCFIVVSGDAQLNQASYSPFPILNWGGGGNTSDAGCKYRLAEVVPPSAPSLSDEAGTYWYRFCTPLRESRYPTNMGLGNAVKGAVTATEASEWKFVGRGDGTFDIVSKVDGGFVSPSSPNNSALVTVAERPAMGWSFKPAATDGYFIIVSGTVQFNQTNNAQKGFDVFNWGGGGNTTDTGCQYAFFLISRTLTSISPVVSGRSQGNCYDLQGRRVLGPRKGVYVIDGRKVVFR